MKYYFYVENDKIIGKGQAKCLNLTCVEVTQEVYNDYEADKYIYIDGEIVLNPQFEEIKVQEERERIGNLSLTKSDVERAIYADKGMDFNDLIEYVKVHAPTMDIKALKIELGANNFFRKHPYINQLGKLLGYTSDDLDYLFENKVLPVKEIINESETKNSETVSEQGE